MIGFSTDDRDAPARIIGGIDEVRKRVDPKIAHVTDVSNGGDDLVRRSVHDSHGGKCKRSTHSINAIGPGVYLDCSWCVSHPNRGDDFICFTINHRQRVTGRVRDIYSIRSGVYSNESRCVDDGILVAYFDSGDYFIRPAGNDRDCVFSCVEDINSVRYLVNLYGTWGTANSDHCHDFIGQAIDNGDSSNRITARNIYAIGSGIDRDTTCSQWDFYSGNHAVETTFNHRYGTAAVIHNINAVCEGSECYRDWVFSHFYRAYHPKRTLSGIPSSCLLSG